MIKSVYSFENHNKLHPDAEVKLLQDTILLLIEDGTSRLLHLQGNFYALSETSTEMLVEALEQGVEIAATGIAAKYEVPKDRVQSELDGFLEQLENKGIVRRRFTDNITRKGKDAPSVTRIMRLCMELIDRFSHTLVVRAWYLMALARISCHLLGWSTTVRIWKQVNEERDKRGNSAQFKPDPDRIDDIVRDVAARHILGMGCKERALSCWSLFHSAGIPAKLIIGIHLFPLASHCWCEYDSKILSDFEDRCKRFTPIFEYH